MKTQDFYKELNQGKIAPYYYFHGEELLAREACDQLIEKALEGGDRSLNLQVFYAGEAESDQIISSAQEFPFMAKRRVILIKQAEKLKAKTQELYIPYLSSPSPQTCLIFWAWEATELKEPLVKFLRQKGRLVAFETMDEEETLSWIKEQLKIKGYTITREAADFLLRTNDELLSLKTEIEKAMLFAGEERNLNLSHLEAATVDFRGTDIYDLTRALGKGDYLEAERILKILLQRSTDPKYILQIFGMILWQLRRMIRIKELIEEGAGPGVVVKQMRMNFAEAQQLAADIQDIPWRHLYSCLREAARVDLLWKRGELRDSWAIYFLAYRLCTATGGK